jgi:hypothetical protein
MIQLFKTLQMLVVVVVHACDHCTWKTDVTGFQIHGSPVIHKKTQSENICENMW